MLSPGGRGPLCWAVEANTQARPVSASGREWIKDSTLGVTNREVIIDTMSKDEVTQTEHAKRERDSRPSAGLRKPRQGQGMFSLGGARTHRGEFTWERGCAVRKLKHWMITNGESKK